MTTNTAADIAEIISCRILRRTIEGKSPSLPMAAAVALTASTIAEIAAAVDASAELCIARTRIHAV